MQSMWRVKRGEEWVSLKQALRSVLLAKINALCASCWDARNCFEYFTALQCLIFQACISHHHTQLYDPISDPR